MAGAGASHWCYADGFKEGNNSGLSHRNDLHVGWRIFCEGKNINYLSQQLMQIKIGRKKYGLL